MAMDPSAHIVLSVKAWRDDVLVFEWISTTQVFFACPWLLPPSGWIQTNLDNPYIFRPLLFQWILVEVNVVILTSCQFSLPILMLAPPIIHMRPTIIFDLMVWWLAPPEFWRPMMVSAPSYSYWRPIVQDFWLAPPNNRGQFID